jgi:hypothetical protein
MDLVTGGSTLRTTIGPCATVAWPPAPTLRQKVGGGGMCPRRKTTWRHMRIKRGTRKRGIMESEAWIVTRGGSNFSVLIHRHTTTNLWGCNFGEV